MPNITETTSWASAKADTDAYVKTIASSVVGDKDAYIKELTSAVQFLKKANVPVDHAGEGNLAVLSTLVRIKMSCVRAMGADHNYKGSKFTGPAAELIHEDAIRKYASSLDYFSPAYDVVAFLVAVTKWEPGECGALVTSYFENSSVIPPKIDLRKRVWYIVCDYSEEIDDEAVAYLVANYCCNGTIRFLVTEPFTERMKHLYDVTGLGHKTIASVSGLNASWDKIGARAPTDIKNLIIQAPVTEDWLKTVPISTNIIVTGDLGGSINLSKLSRRAATLGRFSQVKYVPATITRRIPFPKQMRDAKLGSKAQSLCVRFAFSMIPSSCPLETILRVNHANALDQLTRWNNKQ